MKMIVFAEEIEDVDEIGLFVIAGK